MIFAAGSWRPAELLDWRTTDRATTLVPPGTWINRSLLFGIQELDPASDPARLAHPRAGQEGEADDLEHHLARRQAKIQRAVAGCDGVLTVLVPWGMKHYASGTAQAVLDFAEPDARLVFSCGWHITRDGKDVYSKKLLALVKIGGFLARLVRVVDLDDQVEACDRIFRSDRRWTVVRGSDLEEGDSQGLPVWSRHVGDPILASNLVRRIDFALFMVEALTNPDLIHEAPAIVGCQTESALRSGQASFARVRRQQDGPL